MSLSFSIERIWHNFAFATLVSHVVHITLIISIGTSAWYSHGLSFEIFPIEAFRFLLSSNVSNLLSKEALVTRSMSSIIVWAPKLEVGVFSSRLVDVFASWFMKSREVESDHDITASVSLTSNVTSFTFLFFFTVVIRAVDYKLLSCALWLNDDIVDEDRSIRDLKLGPSLSFIP